MRHQSAVHLSERMRCLAISAVHNSGEAHDRASHTEQRRLSSRVYHTHTHVHAVRCTWEKGWTSKVAPLARPCLA